MANDQDGVGSSLSFNAIDVLYRFGLHVRSWWDGSGAMGPGLDVKVSSKYSKRVFFKRGQLKRSRPNWDVRDVIYAILLTTATIASETIRPNSMPFQRNCMKCSWVPDGFEPRSCACSSMPYTFSHEVRMEFKPNILFWRVML